MAVFPMFIELEEEICLIIGGGRVALRKAGWNVMRCPREPYLPLSGWKPI